MGAERASSMVMRKWVDATAAKVKRRRSVPFWRQISSLLTRVCQWVPSVLASSVADLMKLAALVWSCASVTVR
jgi:hypothetical protein